MTAAVNLGPRWWWWGGGGQSPLGRPGRAPQGEEPRGPTTMGVGGIAHSWRSYKDLLEALPACSLEISSPEALGLTRGRTPT